MKQPLMADGPSTAGPPPVAGGPSDPARGPSDPARGPSDPARGPSDPARGPSDPARGAAAPADPTGEATLEAFRENARYSRFLWERLQAISPRPVAGRILEAGCGIGNLTRLILESPAVASLHAIDLDPAYVERVRTEIPDPRLETAVASLEAYRGPDGAARPHFDFIVSTNVLEHIDDHVAALANLGAQLAPGGTFLLLVPAHPALYCGLDRNLSHFRRYSRGALEEAAQRAGLAVIRLRHFNPVGACGWWWNGKVLRRGLLPAGQLSLYTRFAIPLSAFIDRWNPFPFGVSLLAALGVHQGLAGARSSPGGAS
jgi:SAM-dependent methyltransferase